MSTERYELVTGLLRRVRALPRERWDAFLAEHCPDPVLRREVWRELENQDSATIAPGSRGEEAPEPGPPAPAPERTVGLGKLGKYTLLEVLGEGGMGVVYLAQQQRPSRTVALKVVRPGLMTPRMLRRFEHESQILGRLQHPGIAQVYEADTADTGSGPQPYFAMEMVKGLPLMDYAQSAGLSPRDRAALLIKVCDAVHHAHVKGVLHRDLKPGNILVTPEGEPKVLDFGVARATDSDVQGVTMQSDVGQIVGTIPYMSPEQIAGSDDLDSRSDVYAMGVILYQLLAGRLPHAVSDKTIPEAIRIIGSEDITPLAVIDRALRGDLATIAGKALERDRARRYQSASELAADLGRFLRDEPIAARPPSTVYQVRKFAARHRALVGGVVAAFLLLVAGVVGVSWQAARASAEARRATEESEVAHEVSQFLDGMLRAVSPDQAQGREPTLHELIDAARVELDARRGVNPRVEMALRDTLGHTYHALARLDDARAQFERVRELAMAAFGPENRQTIGARRNLIGVQADKGDFEVAEAQSRAIIADCEKLFGANDPDTVFARMDLARVLQETGRWDEALPLLKAAVDQGRLAVGEDDPRYITALHNMGSAIKDSGRGAEAVGYLREALRLRLKNLGPNHPDTLYTQNNLAAALQRSELPGSRDEAMTLFRSCVEARTRVLGPDHIATITTVSNLAVMLVEAHQLDDALPLATRAYEGWKRQLGEAHPKTLVAMGNLAYLYEDLGRLTDAEALYRVSLDVRRRTSGGKDPETWAPMNNLAMLLQKQHKLAEADALFRELLGLCAQSLPEDHPYVAIFRNNFGDCLVDEGRLDEAVGVLEQSTAHLEAKFGPQHARVLKAYGRLARLYDARQEPGKAAGARAKAQPAPAPGGTLPP